MRYRRREGLAVPPLAELLRLVKEASLLGSCANLLSWDESTHMPAHGSAFRGEQMGLLARLCHEMATSPRLAQLLAAVEQQTLDDVAQANVREIRRTHARAVRVPSALVEELARVCSVAQAAWREARKADDFSLFRPHLERIVALLREKADAIGHGGNRYDALLDEYEPGRRPKGWRRCWPPCGPTW